MQEEQSRRLDLETKINQMYGLNMSLQQHQENSNKRMKIQAEQITKQREKIEAL